MWPLSHESLGRSPPTPPFSLQATSRASHHSSPLLNRPWIMKNPLQELPTCKRHTPSLPPAMLRLWGVGGSKFIPGTQGCCLLGMGKLGAFSSGFMQLIRCCKVTWAGEKNDQKHSPSPLQHKRRCLKLTFVCFTLTTAKEHIQAGHKSNSQSNFLLWTVFNNLKKMVLFFFWAQVP